METYQDNENNKYEDVASLICQPKNIQERECLDLD